MLLAAGYTVIGGNSTSTQPHTAPQIVGMVDMIVSVGFDEPGQDNKAKEVPTKICSIGYNYIIVRLN